MTPLLSSGGSGCCPNERRLERDGARVAIGGRALDVLLALAAQPGQVIHANDLLARVWPHATVGPATLRVQMTALRRALGEEGPRFISTVSGRGYVFNIPRSKLANPADSWDPLQRPSRPRRPTRISGRKDVVAELAGDLARHRFVTVAGAAGIGKTTVAVEVACTIAEAMGVEPYFVDFSTADTPELAKAALLAGLGLTGPTLDLTQTVANFAQGQPLLLVLDNCEHVIDAAAALAEDVIAQIPLALIIATSREPLRAQRERVHHLQPLSGPPLDARPTALEALDFPLLLSS